MHRLFVAIRPYAPIREQLLNAMERITDFHWVGEDNLHLTLRFLGEVERPLANISPPRSAASPPGR